MGTIAADSALGASPSDAGLRLSRLPGEQWLERKSSRIAPRDLANALIGFANADGGTVVIGRSARKVEGTDDNPERRTAQFQANIDFCVPPVRAKGKLIECVDDDGEPDRLLAIEVEPGDSVHPNGKDRLFLRIGDENRRLSFSQRRARLYEKG